MTTTLQDALRYSLIYALSIIGLCLAAPILEMTAQIYTLPLWALVTHFWPRPAEGLLFACNLVVIMQAAVIAMFIWNGNLLAATEDFALVFATLMSFMAIAGAVGQVWII